MDLLFFWTMFCAEDSFEASCVKMHSRSITVLVMYKMSRSLDLLITQANLYFVCRLLTKYKLLNTVDARFKDLSV